MLSFLLVLVVLGETVASPLEAVDVDIPTRILFRQTNINGTKCNA